MKPFFILLMISVLAVSACTAQEANKTELTPNSPKAAVKAEKVADTTDISNYVTGTWITDYQLALKYAAELKRPVLINFTGSDWCIWCKKLSSEVFTQEAFNIFAKNNLVLLKIDFPQKIKLTPEEQKANQALAEKFAVQGFPTIVLVDSEGKELQRTGYQEGGPEKYVAHLRSLLAK